MQALSEESGTGAISGQSGARFQSGGGCPENGDVSVETGGGKPDVLPIPESEKEKADELHNALIEAAAENDGRVDGALF